jgi:hypothetical protein
MKSFDKMGSINININIGSGSGFFSYLTWEAGALTGFRL